MRTVLMIGALCTAGALLGSCGSGPAGTGTEASPPGEGSLAEGLLPETDAGEAPFPQAPFSFGEVWGYVVAGREYALKPELPLTDVGYFGAEVDSYGKLSGVPRRAALQSFSGRVHLVVVCNGRSLTHFALEEGSRTRRQLVSDIIAAARPFDGLQIDFENVPPRDGGSFRSFLEELGRGLEGRILSAALPARTAARSDDVYDYRSIAPLADRILIMAYDEHWSGSSPGPIASLAWCRNIARYGMETVGAEKLIMGIPFYGRTWGDINPNRAFFHSGIERIKTENQITEVQRVDGIPSFSYETRLTVTAYYEDSQSLREKLESYRSLGIRSVGFWSIGQEAPDVWSLFPAK
ncbi:MAG: glycoside hydrolase [Spirochaetaceae bacterium]|jgi:spore germination protein YaaH|nr:glycoside hydrolase [Spirochaetaceae bacterium]